VDIQLAVETDDPQLCVELVGDPIQRNRELELPEGVRLRFKGLQRSSQRGFSTPDLILFALSGPLDMASAVIASVVIRYLTNRQTERHISVKLRGKSGEETRIEADLPSRRAEAILELAEKLQKLVQDC